MSAAGNLLAQLDGETIRRVRTVSRVVELGDTSLALRPLLSVGDEAAVLAFGRWRLGIVVKLTRQRVTVAYTTPSAPDLVRIASTDRARVLWHTRAALS